MVAHAKTLFRDAFDIIFGLIGVAIPFRTCQRRKFGFHCGPMEQVDWMLGMQMLEIYDFIFCYCMNYQM